MAGLSAAARPHGLIVILEFNSKVGERVSGILGLFASPTAPQSTNSAPQPQAARTGTKHRVRRHLSNARFISPFYGLEIVLNGGRHDTQ